MCRSVNAQSCYQFLHIHMLAHMLARKLPFLHCMKIFLHTYSLASSSKMSMKNMAGAVWLTIALVRISAGDYGSFSEQPFTKKNVFV